jgi:ATP-dependent DNA helicase DinG
VLPRIIEPPDLIQCEYAKKKGWPQTFRIGSGLCVRCDRISCGFHPPTSDPTPHAPVHSHEIPASQVLEKRRHKSIEPNELSSETVLKHFPSPTLRRYQSEITTRIVDAFTTGKRCAILAAPTGFGKSYVNAAFASTTQSFFATPQLLLIDQIANDPYLKGRFTQIKGRSNYQCYYHPYRRVNIGRCVTEGYRCSERNDVCPYWMQKIAARNAPAVLTSLAYVISEGQTEGSETYLGKRPLLILDEAHNLEEQCLDHISVRVTPFTIPASVYNQMLPELLGINTDDDVRSFLQSLEDQLQEILEKCETIAQSTGLSTLQAEELDRIRRFLTSYGSYKKSKSEWVWQVRNDELTVQPVFATEFMRELIWKRGEFYIISSATILEPNEFAKVTGLHDFLREDQIEFIAVPSTFPVENRPIIDATVGPLSAQNLPMNMPKAIRAVEEILRNEPGNVAVHCHSYQHQRNLFEGLSGELKPRLIIHSRKDREERLKEWMQSRGKVFLSVAFSEGQDWKYDVCDAQILLKVPFPDLGDRRVRRRLELAGMQWYDSDAMLEVIQAYGRAMRAEDDRARFYIVDGSFNRLVYACGKITPDWFREALPPSLNWN